jgi:hypothetical protein
MNRDNPLVSMLAKRLCIAGALLGSAIGWFMTIVLACGLIADGSLYYNGKPTWLGVPILGYFSFAISWFALRLIRRPLPVNGGTMMPRWFLIMTVAFFVGVALIASIGILMQGKT